MSPWDAHESVLRRAYDAGRRVHVALALDCERFAAHVRERLDARLKRDDVRLSAGSLRAMLRDSKAADLFLAAACDAGIDGAWERLVELHCARLHRLLQHWGATEVEASQLTDELPGELASPPASTGVGTRIGTFDGSGSLASWLAVVARRRWADLARAEKRHGGERPLRATDSTPAPPPLQQLADREAGARLEAALQEAWTGLTPGEALALLYRYADGLPQTRIAVLLGVGPPRVSRLLKQATAKLRRRMPLDVAPGDGSDGDWFLLRSVLEKHMTTFRPPTDLRTKRPHG